MLYQIAGGGEKIFLRCRYNGTLFLPDTSTWQGLKSSGSKNDVEMINFQEQEHPEDYESYDPQIKKY